MTVVFPTPLNTDYGRIERTFSQRSKMLWQMLNTDYGRIESPAWKVSGASASLLNTDYGRIESARAHSLKSFDIFVKHGLW